MEIENVKKDNIYYCECCNYKCLYPAHWKQHIDSEKHKNKGKRKTRSDKILEPQCKECNYTTNNLTCIIKIVQFLFFICWIFSPFTWKMFMSCSLSGAIMVTHNST